jgi:hypothetical protein
VVKAQAQAGTGVSCFPSSQYIWKKWSGRRDTTYAFAALHGIAYRLDLLTN